MKKIAVIGAGNVGGQAAFFCAQRELGEVILIDIKEGLAKGKALDENQALCLLGAAPLIKGSEDLDDVQGADLVLITCGIARKPGMTREQLLTINLNIVRDVSDRIRRLAPGSVVIMMTNPVDLLSYACMKYTGFPRNRVMGQAGVLDTARFVYYIASQKGIAPADVRAMVLGGHGDTMVPLPETATFSGIPMSAALKPEETKEIIEKTRSGGAEIVSYLKDSSAYFAPALSAVLMMESIVRDQKRLYPCSVLAEGEYGLRDVFIGLPCVLSAAGVEKVLAPELPPERKKELCDSGAFYRKQIEDIQL